MVDELMRSAVLTEYIGGAGLRVEDVPKPTPGSGHALIQVAATPINPSDLAFLEGNYSPRPPLPARPGLEGSGTVVAVGSGAMRRFLSGKRESPLLPVVKAAELGPNTWWSQCAWRYR